MNGSQFEISELQREITDLKNQLLLQIAEQCPYAHTRGRVCPLIDLLRRGA